MKMHRILLALLSLTLLVTVTAQAEVIPFDVEVGYRWLSLQGSQEMYRTQVNEREGMILRSFTLSTGSNGATTFDRMRIDASDLGVGPAGSLRIDVEKADIYRLLVRYRRSNAYSALTEFANPLVSQGISLSQHTYNRERNMFDADLEFFPEGRIRPFVGFSTNRYTGPGTSTYHVGQDEFALSSNLRDIDREYRVGTGFNFNDVVYGQVTQGWRRVRTHETMQLIAGQANGNDPGSILGQPQVTTGIERNDNTEVKTPFFSGFVTGQYRMVRVTGNYSRFNAESNGTEDESAAGQFASFPLRRFFGGLDEQAVSNARNRTWRGGARAEATLLEGVDVFAGYQKDHRELDGNALINTLYLQTLTFGGVDPGDIQTVLQATSSMQREEEVTNVGVSAKVIGPLALRAEFRDAKQDVVVNPDLAEIVVPGNQGGRLSRSITTWDINSTLAQNGWLVGAAWRRDNADAPIFRTDYLDRDRLRFRASWTAPNNFGRIGVVNEETLMMNDRADTTFRGQIHQYTAEGELNPLKDLSLRASVSKFHSTTTTLYRKPETFFTDTSTFAEDGKAKEGGVAYTFKTLSLDGGVARFRNEGSNPFEIERIHLRVSVDLPYKTGVAAEVDQNKYTEVGRSLGDYKAKRYGLYLRYHP